MTDKQAGVGAPVAVLHAAVAPDARIDEQDVLVEVKTVSESLRRLGYEPVALATTLDLEATAQALRDLRPSLVVNLVESIGGRDRLQSLAPLLLEAMQLPYTGCGSIAAVQTGSKLAAKRLMRRAGIPTPPWAELAGRAASRDVAVLSGPLRYPALLKSAWDHASFGLEEVYASAAELEEALRRRRRRDAGTELPPVEELFAETYVEGREFNLSLLEGEGGKDGVEVLPAAEMRFVDYPEGKPRIVGYAAKWEAGSFEFTHTLRCFDFDGEDESLVAHLAELARRCWGLFELSGYARVDFRVDSGGGAWVLEVNTNPCLSPDAGLAAAAERGGLSYDALVGRLVRAALERAGCRGNGTLRPGVQKPRSASPAHSASPPRQVSEGTPAVRVRMREEVIPEDVEAVWSITASSGFFSDAEIQLAAELVQERLERGESSGYHFLFAEPVRGARRMLGYSCYGPIPCTGGSYDLYWIAVDAEGRGRGLGTELLRHSEERILRLGGRRIYVETSSRSQYEPTRGFYAGRGYRVETVLADFYAPGDGKVIFVKELR